jgi:hypothetical protein
LFIAYHYSFPLSILFIWEGMVKKHLAWFLIFSCFFVFLAGCVPYSFSPPTQIHINPGDHVDQAVIAVDAAGRSHIAGVVNDRIVYTRTTFGDLKAKTTMTMTSTGTNWKQYDPDIAVTDAGTAWLVWVEQRGNADKIACYQTFPFFPPVGGYDTGCKRLDLGSLTTGNVMVVARGDKAYAIYDAKDDSDRIGALLYKELSNPANTGVIYSYSVHHETGVLHSWSAGIDSAGFLHVAFMENGGLVETRLMYRSNRETDVGGAMTQGWTIATTYLAETDTPIDLSFYIQGTTETMAIASVRETSGKDRITIDSCTVADCTAHMSTYVTLPSSWDTLSVITDVEIVGIGTSLHLGFIGDDSPSLVAQVYYKDNAFNSDPPLMPSASSAAYKFDLEMVKVEPRPESPLPIAVPALAWGEKTNLLSVEYYSYGGLVKTTVYQTDCLSSLVTGEEASNGIYHAGVWQACSDAWFTTKANEAYLPVISK